MSVASVSRGCNRGEVAGSERAKAPRLAERGRVRRLVGRVAGKAGEWNVVLRIDADGHNLAWRVEVAKIVQMPSHRSHISDLGWSRGS